MLTGLARALIAESMLDFLFCQIDEVFESSQDFTSFFHVENTGVSWKVDQTILFVFCQIDELLLAALLARNQSFSTFPI